ncbi:hypothetical protein [Actinoallomurus iriomotensis]|uniref:Uncharacterized protein n=1 Tax=Actinoallomurus iriomotensis TaxID=478107 RepID=A0A9W6S841_9ACTN|nr:hypothetical protein [Actinoallomurus iriomotensis]GLY89104.1 hypothetical protein Airi02_070330 [Actinoallomurus iriomotensis]
MEYATSIFGSAGEVPPPPGAESLQISGMTIVAYFAHRLKSADIQADDIFEDVDDDFGYGYSDKVSSGSELIYSRYYPAGDLPAAIADTIGATPGTGLSQSVISQSGDYFVSAVPFVISTPRNDGLPSIEIDSPLGMSQCLAAIRGITRMDTSAELAAQAAGALVRNGLLKADDIAQTWMLHNCLAVQIWDLTGTAHRDADEMYAGIYESRKYAWEISAILGYPSDHILHDGLWLQRGPELVFHEVSTGFRFLDDHMVFANSACCLEIGHLPAFFRDRSRFRLQNYGYDSSSIFVWSTMALRSAVAEDLTNRYHDVMADFTQREGMSAVEHGTFSRTQLQHLSLIDRLARFRGKLIEPRNRVLNDRIDTLRGISETMQTLSGDMEKAGTMARALVQIREQETQARTNTFLAVLAVALAVVGIPGLVQQFGDWISKDSWWRLSTSIGLIIIVLAVVGWIWKTRE